MKFHHYFRLIVSFAIVSSSLVISCGYRMQSARSQLPDGITSLGIPTFRNLTNTPGVEQTLARALLREFSLRCQARINSSQTGVDAVLMGEVVEITSTPVAFGVEQVGDRTYGTAFLITLRANVRLKRVRDSVILWQHENFVFRERYVLNSDIRDFFAEETPALERLSRNFASSLAGVILDRTNS